MTVSWLLICIVERAALMEGRSGILIFNILFEVTSGYGTVGLSTGVSYDAYSLSGTFHKLSKVVMLLVMVRGRHRGLPLAIDRSILVPGEELLRQMDEEECNHHGGTSTDNKKTLSREGVKSRTMEAEPKKGTAQQNSELEGNGEKSEEKPKWEFKQV